MQRWTRPARKARAGPRSPVTIMSGSSTRGQAGIMVRGMEQLTSDTDRAKAVVAATDMAFYAEQMPGVGQEPPAKVRAVTRLTKQALRAGIHTISDPALKRQAIAARARFTSVRVAARSRGHDELTR